AVVVDCGNRVGARFDKCRIVGARGSFLLSREGVAMRKTWTLLAAGILALSAPAARAEDDKISPEPAGPPAPATVPAPAGACDTSCGRAHGGRLIGWLLYRPIRSSCCGCFQWAGACRPPLYVYFLDQCPHGYGAAGCACQQAPAVPVSAGLAVDATKAPKEEAAIQTVGAEDSGSAQTIVTEETPTPRRGPRGLLPLGGRK